MNFIHTKMDSPFFNPEKPSTLLMELSYRCHRKKKEENSLDPDEGNSRLCSACNLPIFTTPFVTTKSGSSYLHDQCNNLPIQLDDSDLHNSSTPLRKQPNNSPESKCSKCDTVCGDVVYRCRELMCIFQLDVTCALPVKIMHRSHDHKLTVNRCNRGFYCSACETEHRPGLLWARPMPLVYVCSACDFWLHPHCAALPNAIQHERHSHPLLLNYGSRSSTWRCAICREEVSSWGVYSCTKCDYYAHIMCAVTDNQSFEPLLLREAFKKNRVPELVHFPVPDENTSIVRHIAKCTFSTSDDVVQHQHPLTLHHDYPVYNDDDEIDDDVHWLPKCNGCVQFISPPFYTCSQCPKLFLHDCCARLPREARHHPGLWPLHLNGPSKSFVVISETTCCNRLTNGFTYTTSIRNMDVICSLMPDSITHAAHAKTHVLRATLTLANISNEVCRCCNKFVNGISYNCTTCRNFTIHATCASLPATVRHAYDPHPLVLVTAPHLNVESQFCDACEQGLVSRQWYYACSECEQAFHVECVPCLDQLSLIKYEIAEVRVPYHKCPLTLVRGHMVRGRKCGRCGEGYRNSLALECFKCYFSIHLTCFETLSEIFGESKMETISIKNL